MKKAKKLFNTPVDAHNDLIDKFLLESKKERKQIKRGLVKKEDKKKISKLRLKAMMKRAEEREKKAKSPKKGKKKISEIEILPSYQKPVIF
jgi:hypothetical protein